MNKNVLPSFEYLHKRLRYDPGTGILYWREIEAVTLLQQSWNRRFAYKPAGYCDSGYIRIAVDSTPYRAHHIIFKMLHGYDAPVIIDHRDGDGTNNRPENIRAASWAQNAWNRKRRYKDQFKGIWAKHTETRQRWRAAIQKNGVTYHLGSHPTPESAHAAYCEAAMRLYGEFALT